MKVFITVLVLIFSFQSWTKADDISDFEIEGMSIGDSLLDYFSEDEIIKNDGKYYRKKKFITSAFNNHPKLKIFDWLQVSYKRNDPKYIIYSLDGVLEFRKNYKGCLQKKNEIVEELKDMFDSKNTKVDEGKHLADPSGKSLFSNFIFKLDNGHNIVVSCIDWSKKLEKKYFDHLKMWANHREFKEFIISNPY